jgi:hypothetical protein
MLVASVPRVFSVRAGQVRRLTPQAQPARFNSRQLRLQVVIR